MNRTFNFNAGPAALPETVLLEAQKDLLNYQGTGMSVMELSHRSKEYEEIHNGASKKLRKLMNISDDYEVLFLQGGASLQFSMVPMNLLTEDTVGYYVLTGVWSEKALEEAKKLGNTAVLSSSKDENYRRIPSLDLNQIAENAAYLHITSNNTIFGTQWNSFPEQLKVPLIADMSSDILSAPININQFDMVYAGAQKNLGPSGVTVVIMKNHLFERSENSLPTMLNYETHRKNNSLFNTPPTFSIYLLKLVLDWVEDQGGIEGLAEKNDKKARLLYHVIDESSGFYKGHAHLDSRSKMNVTFTLPTEEMTKDFLNQAKEDGFVGLDGHRSVGGCRASIYNAVPLEHVAKLAEFMEQFKRGY
ncbi:3-phosphoserine/phosphohydroxythreonine transaminase [Bacillus sp. 31A1R]|uniref:Phosphoserine aminotransferase n=1 Tax=Robertmurraya mangrovi TaxID=3098077 RepID=A0ABU5ISV4_9BACI|nr:3-phosphoserine/phosphohydroxythreonine transaminase [Bacillus sp. 31A1R]MDZ5470208.1 3-phosphoserine/phosphohydroxythreonine transaminase [Bacillus sp. 31A1R]